ncbi:helix-turn-helix transcriptional regulator [Clostridium sp.]|uniref:helix-turn-helix domain-containing protein n=1 Tax=Clostridium sp. TaxID=1506 RepID=UPI00262CDC22|nr:helix-turn-helix transcriptional regulator [Clostridium sp.]
MFDAELLSNLIKQAQGDISLNNFARQCKISSSTLSRIINAKNSCPPAPSTLQKIAYVAHNNVTYADLMAAAGYINDGETPIEMPATTDTVLTQKDEKDIAKRIEALKEDLLNGDGLMLSGNPISPEAIESLVEALSSGIRQAKIANKKYTPNKYKK